MTKEEIGNIIAFTCADFDASAIALETERVSLRAPSWDDLEDLHAICVQEEVAFKAGWQHSENLEMTKQRLQRYLDDNETLVVILKENGKVIGTISLQNRPWHLYPIDRSIKGRELGFDLSKEYWGRGLIPEAVKALNEYCFAHMGYNFISAGHFSDNLQSKRAIEKCGLTYLFEDDRELPTGKIEHICTYIQYNPRKEITYV